MASGNNRKLATAFARAYTRTSFKLPPGIFKKMVMVFFVGMLAWGYQAIQPPAPKKCGSPGGPPITAPRIKLRDGRYLAYKENGVPRDAAKFKIVFFHGFTSWRHDAVVVNHISPELFNELGIYIVSLNRPGYGESDPNPKRTVMSMALDIEELADQLGLGSKFYIIGFSMGGQTVWSCLKYIPHRLHGAALLAPSINFLEKICKLKEALNQLLPQDRWAFRVARYVPWLTYWWNTQKLFPPMSVIQGIPDVHSKQDLELVNKAAINDRAQATQQGDHESLHRDLMVAFRKWEFEPMDLEKFPNLEGSVHLWQGDEDRLVPVTLQRYIVPKLPWIQYHEVPGAGHMFPMAEGISDRIIKALLIGKN